jgi:excisionase family DNA binding protein
LSADRLLDAHEAAEMLNVKVSLVRELTRRGDLPAIQIGERYWRYRRESLLRWIEARERAGPP